MVTLDLILSQLVLSEESPQIILKGVKFIVVSQSTFDPFAQLVVDDLLLIPLIDQEDARIITLVSDASTNDLVNFPDCSHFVPVVTCDLLVIVLTIQESHLLTRHAKRVVVGMIVHVEWLLWLRWVVAVEGRLVTTTYLIEELFL